MEEETRRRRQKQRKRREVEKKGKKRRKGWGEKIKGGEEECDTNKGNERGRGGEEKEG